MGSSTNNFSENTTELNSHLVESETKEHASVNVGPNEFEPYDEFITRIPIHYARDHGVVCVKKHDIVCLLHLAQTNTQILDQLRRLFGFHLPMQICPAETMVSLINQAYGRRSSQTEAVIAKLDSNDVDLELHASKDNMDLLDAADRAPVVNLVNSLLFDAINQRASDIHIQPTEKSLQVRFRIDGILFDQFVIPRTRQEEVLSRIKIIARMNIAEKRLPQDGRATVRVGNRVIDLRIASLPSIFGERIVIRLLDKSARLYTLSELGMGDQVFQSFRQLIRLEHGIILVTGPTGSGKSTTLYASLQEINSHERNVVTLEDPVEYQLDGISQTQINEKKGMTFASGLRSVLRQDPDVIMVGEIRDEDTAKMAIQSALTGHIVFSTLHTNDAASAITRLLDLGIEPYLVASSVMGVLAQRLVRMVCKKCITETQIPESINNPKGTFQEMLNRQSSMRFFRGAGCSHCRQTGYWGRIGIFELLLVNDAIRKAIQDSGNASEIRQMAMEDGLQLMYADGLGKIKDGTTTLDEVLRVSQSGS